MMNSATAFAPATVANLGSGFDILGLAINDIGDFVTVHVYDKPGIHITSITGDNGVLTHDPTANTATVAMQAMLNHLHLEGSYGVQIDKKLPLGSGLGSSAASAVAGVMALNAYLQSPFTKEQLIPFALQGEYIASKGFHADNIAPCMLGGITLVHNLPTLSISNLPVPPEWYIVTLHQPLQILTSEARALMPTHYSRNDVVIQTTNLASLIHGLHTANPQFVKQGLTDVIATPYRQGLIPHFQPLANIAHQNHCMGFNISGSGPTVFALCESLGVASQIENAWNNYMLTHKAPCTAHLSAINIIGAHIVSSQ